jgi:NAD(P)-dependent dehydrogenase (short-subunit alcohol dehydrogenase family)
MQQISFDIKGKKVLVLNPEKPYGPEAVRGMMQLGAEVLLSSPDVEGLRGAAQGLGIEATRCLHAAPCTEEEALRLAKWVEDAFGPPDALVVISAGSRLQGWTTSFEALMDSLRPSQLGLMLAVKHLGLLMSQAGRGSVVFITDYGALVGYDPANYAQDPDLLDTDFTLDKGYISGSFVNYARQAAGFLGEHSIRCNALALGPLPDPLHPGFGEAIVRHSHIKRLLTQADIAGALAFLISDASSFITGVTLPVDGGYTAK